MKCMLIELVKADMKAQKVEVKRKGRGRRFLRKKSSHPVNPVDPV
ncbi:hypothetical protein ACFLS1_07575 [Verrucomicrobiota bacterium]